MLSILIMVTNKRCWIMFLFFSCRFFWITLWSWYEMTFNTVKRCMYVCLCVCAIFLDILLQKVTALWSFVFVDSVSKIKANLCGERVFFFFFTNFTMALDVQIRAVRLGYSEWCGEGRWHLMLLPLKLAEGQLVILQHHVMKAITVNCFHLRWTLQSYLTDSLRLQGMTTTINCI